jgi:ubiquinone/menaquinone biosynthesis C-methylase UbiE
MEDPQTDPEFLRSEAYAEAAPLDTRSRLQDECGTNPESWFDWLSRHTRLPENAVILELGCGPGGLWLAGPPGLPESSQIHLTDLSEGMASEARRRLDGSSARFQYLCADAQDIPYPSQTFNVILAHGLLDHVPDRGRALGEIRRTLQPGSFFYASTGSRTHLQEIEDLVRPFLSQADFGGAAERFGLENGALLLSPWFTDVELHRYASELVFESPDPLLEYVLSEAGVRRRLTGERLVAFKRSLLDLFENQAELRVNVDKGLFITRRR